MEETYKILSKQYNLISELWFKTTGENRTRETRQLAYKMNLVIQRLDIGKNSFRTERPQYGTIYQHPSRVFNEVFQGWL